MLHTMIDFAGGSAMVYMVYIMACVYRADRTRARRARLKRSRDATAKRRANMSGWVPIEVEYREIKEQA